MKKERVDFGITKEGHSVKGIQLRNNNGITISVINWGATLISVKTPDKNGKCEEITLGFDNIADYQDHSPYFGSTVGRVANRIRDGRFVIKDRVYQLEKNEKGINHLHGGPKGISTLIWEMDSEEDGVITCQYRSVDGEEGYPGNLDITVSYSLTESNEIIIDYKAETDKVCPVNLTNHTYWNLSGNRKRSILDHELTLACDHYLPVDEHLIPTGELKPVAGTPWDFRKAKPIGKDIAAAGDYDHCYAIGMERSECKTVALVLDAESGREMGVATTEPGIQFYSGNYLDKLKEQGFQNHDGLCLEAEGFPDAVNRKDFPSVWLSPGEIYTQQTIHRFRVR